jgi:aspartyl-tRNA(Asn)/glutamyl-tRNA(Gln) amidotransferase subunit C
LSLFFKKIRTRTMKISIAEVRQVAKLARLQLAENETVLLTEQLDRILSYIAKLNELDTSGIAPTTHALSLQNAFRDDLVEPSLPRQEALANAPLDNGESFVVPKVI